MVNTYIYFFQFFPSNFIFVQVQFSAFSPHPRLTPSPPHIAPVSTPTPVIVQVSFIIFPTNPSPFSPEIPSPLPSGHCWPFLNFSVFGYILLVIHTYIFKSKQLRTMQTYYMDSAVLISFYRCGISDIWASFGSVQGGIEQLLGVSISIRGCGLQFCQSLTVIWGRQFFFILLYMPKTCH